MKKLIAIALLFSCFIRAEKKPEQWLTPERRAALNVIVTRPVIVKKEHMPDGRMILTWTNGLHGCVTTQKVEKVLGKPSKDARRDKLEAIKAERDTAKAERDALKVENDNLKKTPKKETK
jgi:hypothetical protein